MATERIKQLQQYYAEDPHDPFNIYALALEYLRLEPAKARQLFDILLAHHGEYLPTYYHAARFFQDSGEKEKAIKIFQSGIALARKLNNSKALRELQSAYDELTFE